MPILEMGGGHSPYISAHLFITGESEKKSMSDLSFIGGNTGQSFVVTEDDYGTSFEPIPQGTYAATITESDERENSKGTGTFVEFKAQIAEGVHKGRELRFYMNTRHENPQVMEIASTDWKRLASYCLPKGTELTSTDQFIGKTLMVKVTTRNYTTKDGDDRVGNSTKIWSKYKPQEMYAGNQAQPQPAQPNTVQNYHQQPAQPPVQHQQVSNNSNPWDQ